MYLFQRLIAALEINKDNLIRNVSLEALRLVKEKREQCLTLLAYHTCRTKEEVFDNQFIEERKALLGKEMDEEDIASLLLIVLQGDKTDVFCQHLGIDKEQQRLATISKIKKKNDKNSIDIGGMSVYGTLIDSACERYGWTKDYVVWGIDYTSLRMMLADKVNSVFLTDDERKRMPASVFTRSEDVIKATKENMERIKAMNWK